jgi:hypothetical protein
MSLRRSRRVLAVLALSLLASLSPVLAQPGPRPSPPEGVFETLRGGLAQFQAGLLGLLSKVGMHIDPNGGLNDAGSRLDPDGAAAENEAGSSLNPDGQS